MEKIFLKNKKGNVPVAVIIIAVAVFIVGLSTMTMQQPFEELVTEIQNDPDMGNFSKELALEQNQNFQTSWDGLIVFMFAMLWLFGLVSSFFIDSHPFFFIISIFLLFVSFYTVAVLANEFLDITSEEGLVEYNQDYPFTIWIMSHLLELSIAMGFTFAIALYAKFRGGGM